MKIEIDPDKCIGAGQCVLAAPDLFSQDETTGLAIAPGRIENPDLFDRARDAERACPARAIRIVE